MKPPPLFSSLLALADHITHNDDDDCIFPLHSSCEELYVETHVVCVYVFICVWIDVCGYIYVCVCVCCDPSTHLRGPPSA